MSKTFKRSQAKTLSQRLREERRFIQVVSGPRQVGKTTMVNQVINELGRPVHFANADAPGLQSSNWLEVQWNAARLKIQDSDEGAVLVLDEVQKIPDWSELIKKLWDEDTRKTTHLQVVLLGSVPLLLNNGLSESLAGRFELLHMPHWSFTEMRDAFGWDVTQYIVYGGYPGSAPLISEPDRWARYVRDSLIETTISRDVLLMTRVDKPALLRQLFDLGCRYSGQILSFTKMMGQLQDSGNTSTLAHYLDLLSGAGMISGIRKYSGEAVRTRGSSPKLQILNTALITAQSGMSLDDSLNDSEYWGRLVESAVGAHLLNSTADKWVEVFYWREKNEEVDFVLKTPNSLVGIEVKSSRPRGARKGLEKFKKEFNATRTLLVGGDGISLEDFFTTPLKNFL